DYLFDNRDLAPFVFGGAGDLPVTGDWNRDKVADIGIYRAGTWFLDTNSDHSGSGDDLPFAFGGQPGDIPVTGDWNHDRRLSVDHWGVGIYRGGTWILDTNNDYLYSPLL